MRRVKVQKFLKDVCVCKGECRLHIKLCIIVCSFVQELYIRIILYYVLYYIILLLHLHVLCVCMKLCLYMHVFVCVCGKILCAHASVRERNVCRSGPSVRHEPDVSSGPYILYSALYPVV